LRDPHRPPAAWRSRRSAHGEQEGIARQRLSTRFRNSAA
jgi:hypothetical protein